MRILFMGTPGFRGRIAEAAVEDGHDICGVFTQPDKPRNRNKVTFSACKGICPVMRPECLPTGENAGWNSAGACKNDGAGADCGGGLWTHSSPGYSGGAASWLLSMCTPRCCRNIGARRPSTGPCSTAMPRPAFPLCRWTRAGYRRCALLREDRH